VLLLSSKYMISYLTGLVKGPELVKLRFS